LVEAGWNAARTQMRVKTTVMGRSKEEKLTGATCGSGVGLARRRRWPGESDSDSDA
jgi:hypothetical protein